MVKEEEEQSVDAKIERALTSRLQYFKDNAADLTLAKIRRLMEEDLGFEKFALDAHKSFIKQFVEKNLNDEDDYDSKNSEAKEVNSTLGEGKECPKRHEIEKEMRGASPKDEAKMDADSPIMGVLTTKSELVSNQGIDISESMIKKAIRERADYIRSHVETLTLAGARRFLEEDLKLSKNALDPFKKFIRKQIEEIIDNNVLSTSETGAEKKSFANRQSKGAESTGSEGRLASTDNKNDVEEHKAKPRERATQRFKNKKLDREKKRKRSEKKTDSYGKKQGKLAKKQSEENSDADNGGGMSEDGESQSSAEKPVKKKEAPTPIFGKHIEHLKSVIKACGMSIAPTVYKKAKQVSDSKREAFLTKELEEILSKEGLSKDPSEKEIKEVRKRKERAKELEGIDLSNIVTSSRRRSTLSFMPPPRPKRKDEGRDNATSTNKDKDDGNSEKKKEDVVVEEEEQKEEEEADKEEEEEEEEEEEDGDDSQNELFSEDDGGSD